MGSERQVLRLTGRRRLAMDRQLLGVFLTFNGKILLRRRNEISGKNLLGP